MNRILPLLLLLVAATAAAADLPLVEVAAAPQKQSDTVAVIISGDGGWAKIDKSLAAVLTAEGMPVVGLNSLQYFMTKRTPDDASRDLQTIIERYLTQWRKSRVLLVGYSRGADVLPGMASRLPAPLQAKIRLMALLAPSPNAEYEFHVMDWFRDSNKGIAVKPDLERMSASTICIWGEDDKESLCNGLKLPHVKVVMLKGAHHFDGGYETLGRLIVGALP